MARELPRFKPMIQTCLKVSERYEPVATSSNLPDCMKTPSSTGRQALFFKIFTSKKFHLDDYFHYNPFTLIITLKLCCLTN